MRTRMLVVLLLVVGLTPGLASAQQLFDFYGQAIVPTVVGNSLTMYSVVRDPAPGTTPIPLDFDNFEYTIVITDLKLDIDGSPQFYSLGTVTLYEDATTLADYANPGTFTDGTAILVGIIPSLSRNMFVPTLGSASGTVDWYGGTRIAEIPPSFRGNWPILVGINGNGTDPGYDEIWDGKIEPREPIATDTDSWGAVKSRY